METARLRGDRMERVRSDACWLCGRNGAGDPLDEHHIFGGANRGLSERFGLTVPLCHSRCHIFGPDAAHRNAETAQKLHEYGQRKAMEEQGWTRDAFRMIFGKNYIDEDAPTKQMMMPTGTDGFRITSLEMPF